MATTDDIDVERFVKKVGEFLFFLPVYAQVLGDSLEVTATCYLHPDDARDLESSMAVEFIQDMFSKPREQVVKKWYKKDAPWTMASLRS